MFGGKDVITKEITNKSFELVQDEESSSYQLLRINNMIKNRSRSVVASFDFKIGK